MSEAVTPEEFVLENQQTVPGGARLATVMGLFENKTAKVQFHGESEPSQKQYSYMSTYMPVEQDTVLMMPVGDTYIILGKVIYNEAPSSGKVELADRALQADNADAAKIATKLRDDSGGTSDYILIGVYNGYIQVFFSRLNRWYKLTVQA